jgi:hypothetical protein
MSFDRKSTRLFQSDNNFQEPLRSLYVPKGCWEPPSGKVIVQAGDYAGKIGVAASENVFNIKGYENPKTSRFAKAERSYGENCVPLNVLARHFGVSDGVLRKLL